MPGPRRSPLGSFSDALNHIASGTLDDKVRWIAQHDPDWFVANVLARRLDAIGDPSGGVRIDEHMVDQAIASIALRDASRMPDRAAG